MLSIFHLGPWLSDYRDEWVIEKIHALLLGQETFI